MAVFEITAPDGKKYRVTGDNYEGALQALQTKLGQGFQATKPRDEISDTGGMAAHATQGALASFGDEYMAGLSAVLGVQPDGSGGANWFQYDKPLRERYGVALDAIRSEMGEYSEENPWKAGGSQVAGAVAGAVAAAPKVMQATQAIGVPIATTLKAKAAQLAAGGAIGGAIEGFGAGEGGAGSRAKSAAVGAGIGAVFAPLVGLGASKVVQKAEQLYGKAARAVFANRRMYNPNTGQITEAGRRRLADLGFDDLSAMSDEMQRAFGVAAERAVDAGADVNTGATVARVARGERFGVPLTRGQSTGEVAQIAAEENFRAGTRGAGAYNAITEFDNMQRTAVDGARSSVIGGATEAVPNRIDAAESVISGVRREAEAARRAGAQAYDTLEKSGAAVGGDWFPSLRQNIETAVKSEGVSLDAATPNAQSALDVLQNVFEGSKRGSVPFNDIERARQRILGFRRAAEKGSNGADTLAIGKVVDEFDRWLDDTITEALISGDDAVLGQAKEARTLWAKYRSTFLGKDGADNFIRKIVEDDLAPDQVAGWMFGASSNIGGGQSSLVAKRVKGILGEASPEWQEVKRAGWDRVTKNTEGKEAWGPQRIAGNISELLSGKGQTLSRELYTPQELQVMAEFRDLLNVLTPPKKATNPSGTSYDLQRAVGELTRNMSVFLGGAAGGPAGAVGAATATQAVSEARGFSAALQARAAARGITFAPPRQSVAIGAGVGAGAVAQEETIR